MRATRAQTESSCEGYYLINGDRISTDACDWANDGVCDCRGRRR